MKFEAFRYSRLIACSEQRNRTRSDKEGILKDTWNKHTKIKSEENQIGILDETNQH